MEQKFTQEDIMKLLDSLYDKAIQGLPVVSPTIGTLADGYLLRNKDIESAAKSFISYQTAKCTTSGFLAGIGGLITLPVAIPANISSVLYVQMRMIAGLAYMGGYDTNSDQVQTLVYACLAGVSVNQLIKQAGIKFGVKFGNAAVKKIPGAVLTKINQKVGFRLITKFGEKGIVNLGKMIPIVGGIIGGGFDLTETKGIAQRAYKLFIQGDISALSDNGESETEVVHTDLSDKTVGEIFDSMTDEQKEAVYAVIGYALSDEDEDEDEDNEDTQDTEYFCTRCGAILNLQEGFNPDLDVWYCKGCGQLLSGDVKEGERYPGYMWFCDKCNELLNKQDGFTDTEPTWTCTKCGHINTLNPAIE